jgi:hypothetical protein
MSKLIIIQNLKAMNISAKTYMIYCYNGKYEVCDESFSNYIKEDEVVERGFTNCATARLKAGYMNCGIL